MNDITNHAAIESAAAAWLARRDANDRWTSGDDAALHAWISESAAHRVAWLRLEAAWQRTERMPALAAVPQRADARHRSRAMAGWALAASLMLGVSIAWVVRFDPFGTSRYATDVGNRESVTLADGSRVTLNTHTRGRAVVNEKERRFWLEEGEAFFEVEHDPSRPFVVMAGSDTVTVLGTRFSVRHEDGQTSVTVVEGKVRLDTAAQRGKPVVMTPNEAAVSRAGSLLVIGKTADEVKDELSWREGRLTFSDMTLADVAAEFNRYNRVQIEVRGSAAELRLSGSFDSNNYEGFARLADEGFGLSTRRDGDRIVLGAD